MHCNFATEIIGERALHEKLINKTAMDKIKKDCLLMAFGGFISFFVSARIFALQSLPEFNGEIVNHSTLIIKLQGNNFLYSIWYLFQKLIILDDVRPPVLIASGFLILGMIAFMKGAFLSALFTFSKYPAIYTAAMVLLLCLAAPVDFPFFQRWSPGFEMNAFYIGTIPPNTFMSATQYVANSFSIPAVFAIAIYFNDPSKKNYIWALSLGLLAVLAKPGIAPGLLAAWGILFLCFLKNSKVAMAQCCVFIALIAAPTLTIYFTMMTGGWSSIKTTFAPLATWDYYSTNHFIDLLESWIFPIFVLVAVLLDRTTGRMDRIYLSVAWITAVFSLLPFIFLAESMGGKVLNSGNYLWGAIAATSALYAVSAYVVSSRKWKFKAAPLLTLAWCGFSGYSNLVHYASTGTYL